MPEKSDMRNTVTTGLILVISAGASGQHQTTKDSISIFYDSLFDQMQQSYLFRKEINWTDVVPLIRNKALEAPDFQESLRQCVFLFDTIGDTHCQIFYRDRHFVNSNGKSYGVEDFSEQYIRKYTEGAHFEVKVIEGKYGYVLIPGMLLLDADTDSLSRTAQSMYDRIAALENNHEMEGWILDLRFNIGGNAFPMITALYHLLGDTEVYLGLDQDKNLYLRHELRKGIFLTDGKKESAVMPARPPDPTVPVAVVVGKLTASAGEDVAISFKGRANTVFIGEATAGYLTGNDKVELPFGVTMAMTTVYIADRNSRYRERLMPDLVVEKKDNFEVLTKDQNVLEAIHYFRSIE